MLSSQSCRLHLCTTLIRDLAERSIVTTSEMVLDQKIWGCKRSNVQTSKYVERYDT
jgi:hypothetical protein